MRKITFRQIEAFHAVITSGSISAGAANMGLTQPAVSRLVRDLEEHLKLRLFVRRGNSILPTPEAEILVEDVAQQLRGLDRIEESAAFIRDAKKGTMHVTAMLGATTRFLPTLVSQYLDQFPLARVTIQSVYSTAVVEGVASRRFDFGFAHVEGENPAIRTEHLTGMRVVAVMAADHELAATEELDVDHLHGQPLLSLGMQSPVWVQFSALLSTHGIRPKVACAAGAAETLCTLAALRKGIAIVDPFTAYGLVDPRLTVRSIRPKIDYDISMIFQRGRLVPRSVQAFADLVRTGVQELADGCFGEAGIRATHPSGEVQTTS